MRGFLTGILPGRVGILTAHFVSCQKSPGLPAGGYLGLHIDWCIIGPCECICKFSEKFTVQFQRNGVPKISNFGLIFDEKWLPWQQKLSNFLVFMKNGIFHGLDYFSQLSQIFSPIFLNLCWDIFTNDT